MIANYHTHTARCRHALGTDEEYVQSALKRGLRILGFSDHAPYVFEGTYYSNYRMYMHQLMDYVLSVEGLKKKYAGQIQIHLGLELEYYPKYLPEVLERLRDTPIEYVLLGQHFLGNEMDEPYSGAPTEDVSILKRYCDQVIEALNTGLFTYLAHPDLINFTGDRKIFREQMRRVCREAKGLGLPVEMNLYGLNLNRNYPGHDFFAVAAEEGCQVILGCDAHHPVQLEDKLLEQRALEFLKPYDLELISTVPLRSIHK